jgi:hypothetical protein
LKVESRGYADDRDVGELPIGSLEFANDWVDALRVLVAIL